MRAIFNKKKEKKNPPPIFEVYVFLVIYYLVYIPKNAITFLLLGFHVSFWEDRASGPSYSFYLWWLVTRHFYEVSLF